MADRRRPNYKKPDEILASVFEGHHEAQLAGPENGKKYLQNYLEKFNSIPNTVKFFIYDLLAEDAYQVDDIEVCRQAVEHAREYLKEVQAEDPRQLAEYSGKLRFIERGISVMVDAGEFQKAIALCDLAIELGLGQVYRAKKASIERML